MKSIALSKGSIAMMLAAVALFPSCSKNQQQMQQGAAPEIATITLSPQSADLQSTYPATIKGKTDIEIRPQVTGFITKVLVDEGQRVRKGQTLFTLDQVTFQAAVDQARAAVSTAQTAVNTAKMTADSKKTLFDKNIISEYEYQLSQNSLAQAESQLANAKAALASAQKNLAYTVVTAPSDGVVGSIPNREGSLASPSSAQPLTTVSDNSQVYAYFSLNEKQILDLTDGGASTLEAAIAAMPEVKLRLANGTTFPNPGKVATVSGVIDASTGSATVRALFSNNNNMLRSGSTGSVIMPMNQTDVIIVPQKATFEVQDRKFVYTVDADNVLHSTPIEVLGIQDGRNYVVTSGLNQGDRIVVEGVGVKARDGITITPVDAAAQQQNKQ